MTRVLTIMGATGSVGRRALELIGQNPALFTIDALTAHKQADELAVLARQFKAKRAIIADPSHYDELRAALEGSGIAAEAGRQALEEAAQGEAEWVLLAISGAAGLAPALAAARTGKTLALANKECLVAGAPLLLAACAGSGSVMIPVDSEHNALFQMLTPRGGLLAADERPERIILTATGGPFRGWSAGQMAKATPEQACAHPVWNMGRKISVDSASLMNKALELIEAHHIFAFPPERLGIVIHPQGLVHALIVKKGQAMMAHIGAADMGHPIAHALSFPDSACDLAGNPRAPEPAELGKLEFLPVDEERFPAPALAREVMRTGGAAPVVFNAANEAAVAAFLEGRVGFLDIVRIAGESLGLCAGLREFSCPPADLKTIEEADTFARQTAEQLIVRFESRRL